MAVGLPLKTTYADGDVYSASDVNDTNGTINANVNPYTAGKNLFINGNLAVNQRAFTSNTTSASFNFDRFWQLSTGGGTLTTTPQVLAPATISGYGGTNYVRCVTASQSAVSDYAIYSYRGFEDVRTSAGQTVTISFYAKASSGTPKIGIETDQFFGAGGSSSVTTALGTVTLSTSWARYSITATVPSVSGKTINAGNSTAIYFWLSAGSNFNSRTGSIGNQNNTFEMTGFQYEIGSTATAFQTATGTIQGELAACQRYYFRANANGTPYGKTSMGGGNSSTAYWADTDFPVAMRVAPTALDTATIGNYRILNYADTTSATPSAVTLDTNITTNTNGRTLWTTSGLTANVLYYSRGNNTASSYLGFSAEL